MRLNIPWFKLSIIISNVKQQVTHRCIKIETQFLFVNNYLKPHLKNKTLRIRIKCLFIPKAICASSNSILCSLYLLSVFQQLAYTLNAFCHVTKTITQPGRFAEAPPMVTQVLLVNFEKNHKLLQRLNIFIKQTFYGGSFQSWKVKRHVLWQDYNWIIYWIQSNLKEKHGGTEYCSTIVVV